MAHPLSERYVIGEEIGRGGMAVVHRARDLRLGRDVAIKLLKTEPPPSAEVLELFRQEALATSRLTHPNIVNLHDFGELADGRLFLVMELLEGCTLANLLELCRASGAALPWTRACDIALQLCAALSVAHAHKILHRDMTPANCFLVGGMRRDHVKVLDFGISRVRESTQTVTLSRRGDSEPLMGTPYYMAPEVLRGERGDHRVDVYAVGVLLYEMTTGARPFTAANLFVLLKTIAEGSFEEPLQRNPQADLDAARQKVILRAMASDPAERYQSAGELADALEASLHHSSEGSSVRGNGGSQSSADPLERTLPATPRRPRHGVGMVSTAGLLGAGTLAAWLFAGDPADAGTQPSPSAPTSAPAPSSTTQQQPALAPAPAPASERAAIEAQRRRELDHGLKSTKARRDACLIATRTFMRPYHLPLEISVAADGVARFVAAEAAESPSQPRLPVKAVPCMLEILASIPFTPAKLPVTLREALVLD